ncbi:MAG: hypothetical protein HY023_06640 [Chloroflexi bacterium]|nr:hypothetical protein [Chloroflexota bacterium]MBI3763105.1 hypothetical protein [Chloroflexota bacterium]
MLASIESYSRFVYARLDNAASIRRHTVRLYTDSAATGVLEGRVEFEGDLALSVFERLDFGRSRILFYSYEIYRGDELLTWYDPQPHPDDPSLASTHPHHKHVPPDIKHHRIPAPGISFSEPNLPVLISEVEALSVSQ